MRTLKIHLFAAAVAFTLLAPRLALAQDAGSAHNDDVTSITQAAQEVVHAATTPGSPKWLLVLAVLVAAVRLAKRFAPRIPALGAFLGTHPWGEYVLSLALSIGGALLTGIPAGQPVTLSVLMSAVVAGLAAAGMPFGEKASVAQAQAGGKAADPATTLNS